MKNERRARESDLIMTNKQLDNWVGAFGEDYMARNSDMTEADLGPRTRGLAGVLAACPTPPASILEVGANIGRNLVALARCTDARLYGVEPFEAAYGRMIEALGDRLAGSACTTGQALPYDDASIDMVFTSGVLIHVSPADLPAVMSEIVRVARRYVWCNEYFAKQPEEIAYRGKSGLLFKRDFGRLYLERFPRLRAVAQGFLWSATSPFDDTTWWLFEKPTP
jgi:pseudaminic acid biosynthesis-associated methylase